MLNEGMLQRYKAQNPKKYAAKYGDKSIEEILGTAKPEMPAPAVMATEFSVKKDIQAAFSPVAPIVTPQPKPLLEENHAENPPKTEEPKRKYTKHV